MDRLQPNYKHVQMQERLGVNYILIRQKKLKVISGCDFNQTFSCSPPFLSKSLVLAIHCVWQRGSDTIITFQQAKITCMKNHLLVVRIDQTEHVYCCILVDFPLLTHTVGEQGKYSQSISTDVWSKHHVSVFPSVFKIAFVKITSVCY